MKVKIICAWCKETIGEKEGIGGITHGICEKCEEKIKKTNQNKIKAAQK